MILEGTFRSLSRRSFVGTLPWVVDRRIRRFEGELMRGRFEVPARFGESQFGGYRTGWWWLRTTIDRGRGTLGGNI